MKVRTRSRLILSGTIVVFLIVLSLITQSVILESFRNLEAQDAHANMQRVLSTLNNEVEQVAASCRDWAEWDDTYAFIENTDPGYIRSNLAEATAFQNLGFNYVMFYNSSGSLVYSKGYNTDDGTEIVVPQQLDEIVKNSIIPAGVPEGVSGRRGFSILDGKPIIIVGYRITTTNRTSAPRGTVVIAKIFDSGQMNNLAQQTQLDIDFIPVPDSVPPGSVNGTDWKKMVKGAIITRPLNDSVMAGSAVITGIENKPTMILVNVETERHVNTNVQNSIIILAAAIVILGLILLFVVQMLLQKYILAPLDTLDSGMKDIGKSGDLSQRVPEKGDEEIISLTRSLNLMLGNIQKQSNELGNAKQALAERNTDLENLLEEIRQQNNELDDAKSDLAERNTELEMLLEEIQQQRDELDSAQRALAERNQALEELNRKANLYLDIYLDSITYEILNAMMGLQGYAEFLKDTTSDKERMLADRIIGLTKKTRDVIRNIETISRIYKTPPKIRPVILESVLKNEVEMKPGIAINLANCDRVVLADEMLGVVFDNLFSNSIKFGGTNVEIFVSTRDTGDGNLEISVADNGPGIPDVTKPKIFDRFVHDSRTRGSYGLGLHIVKMLIESYGGKVWADDRVAGEPTSGIVIRFVLRLA